MGTAFRAPGPQGGALGDCRAGSRRSRGLVQPGPLTSVHPRLGPPWHKVPSFAAERAFQEKVVCPGPPGTESALLQESTGKSPCRPRPRSPEREAGSVLVGRLQAGTTWPGHSLCLSHLCMKLLPLPRRKSLTWIQNAANVGKWGVFRPLVSRAHV